MSILRWGYFSSCLDVVFFVLKMPQSRSTFSIIGRSHLSKSLSDLAKPHSSARFSVEYLRPEVRGVLVALAAGEGIHPEIVRVNLAGCVKQAALRAVVYTIPSKERGLRIQSIFAGLTDREVSAQRCQGIHLSLALTCLLLPLEHVLVCPCEHLQALVNMPVPRPHAGCLACPPG